MTATPDSIVMQVLSTVGKDWQYGGSTGPGAVDFQVDGKRFFLFVVDAAGFDNIAVIGDPVYVEHPTDGTELTATQAAEIERAQMLAEMEGEADA